MSCRYYGLCQNFYLLLMLKMLCSVVPQSNKVKAPPSIYKWIAENAHVCTIIPEEGKTLIDFMTEEESKDCHACPVINERDLPGVACAWEFEPDSLDPKIGCHEIPQVCIEELMLEFGDFYLSNPEVNPESIGNEISSFREDFEREKPGLSLTSTSASTSTTNPNEFVQGFTMDLEPDMETEEHFGTFDQFFGSLLPEEVTGHDQTTERFHLTPKFKETATTRPTSTTTMVSISTSNDFEDFRKFFSPIFDEDEEGRESTSLSKEESDNTTPTTSFRLTPKFRERTMEHPTLIHKLRISTATPETTTKEGITLPKASTTRARSPLMLTTKNARPFVHKITLPFRTATTKTRIPPTSESQDFDELVSKLSIDVKNTLGQELTMIHEPTTLEIISESSVALNTTNTNVALSEFPEFSENPTITITRAPFNHTPVFLEKMAEVIHDHIKSTKRAMDKDRFYMGTTPISGVRKSTQATHDNRVMLQFETETTTPMTDKTWTIRRLPSTMTTATIETQDRIPECNDHHGLCCFWALNEECEKNPFYMKVHCAKSCGTCHCSIHETDECHSTGIHCRVPLPTIEILQKSRMPGPAPVPTLKQLDTTTVFPPSTHLQTLPTYSYSFEPIASKIEPIPIQPIPISKMEPMYVRKTLNTHSLNENMLKSAFKSAEDFENLYMRPPEPIPPIFVEPTTHTTTKIDLPLLEYEENTSLRFQTSTTSPRILLPPLRSEKFLQDLKKLQENFQSLQKSDQPVYSKRIHEMKKINILPPLKSYVGKTRKIDRKKLLFSNPEWFNIPSFAKAANAFNINVGHESQKGTIVGREYGRDPARPHQNGHLSLSEQTLPKQSVFSIFKVDHPECFNYHRLCKYWASIGECDSNPFWMRPHCQESCKSCGETIDSVYIPEPMSGCVNEHRLCPYWWFIGECTNNPSYMLKHCRLSCNVCWKRPLLGF